MEPSPVASATPKTYRVGTLTYTKSQLFQVMFWMLWGDFFFQLLESVTPALEPLQLRLVEAARAALTMTLVKQHDW